MELYDFDRVVAGEEKKPILFEFFASWSGASQLVSPIMARAKLQFEKQILFKKLDFDENAELVIRYRLQSVPSLLFFKEGELLERRQGIFSYDELVARLQILFLSKIPEFSAEKMPREPRLIQRTQYETKREIS
jgi:thioredoxin 1